MIKPSDDTKATGSSLRLSYNRSGLGCLLIIGTPLVLILSWLYIPKGWILRFELEHQQRRLARETIKMSNPSVISVLQEYLSHHNPEVRTLTVHASGDFLEYHPNESRPLISTLCQLAQYDNNFRVRTEILSTLRRVYFTSLEIDQTILALIDHKNEAIRLGAEELFLTRIVLEMEMSSSLCDISKRLKARLIDVAPEDCAAK